MESVLTEIIYFLKSLSELLKNPLFQGIASAVGVLVIIYGIIKFLFHKKQPIIFFSIYRQIMKAKDARYTGFAYDWVPVRKSKKNGQEKALNPVAELKDLVKNKNTKFIIVSGTGGMGKSRLAWEFAKKHKKECAFFDWNQQNLDLIKISRELNALPGKVSYLPTTTLMII